METNYLNPSGKLLFDKYETVLVKDFEIDGFIHNNIDLSKMFQLKYYNFLFKNTLLTDPPAPPTYLYYKTDEYDLNKFFSAFNSIYCILDSYKVNDFTKVINASVLYADQSYPPYTYKWSLITDYNGGPTYPIDSKTIISDSTSSSTSFTGYTKQYAQCIVTDSRGYNGYSKAVLLNFI